MAAPNAAPYKISKRGDKYVVVNNANAVKATFADRNKAIAYLRALYANVPGAKRKAAKVKWTGKAKVPVKAAADTSPWTPRQLWHMAAAAGYQRADVEADTLQAPVDDDLEDTIMALLDATFTMLEQMGVEVLSLELQHALEAVRAGEPINDKILALLGIDDEDTAMTEAAADSAKPYGNVSYADPGYQKDKKKRYPIDTADHVRSAWSYISQSSNASKYSPAQRESIKARIRTAAKKFKVELSEPQKADAWDRYAELERLEQQQAAIEELRAMGRTCHCDVDDGGHAQDCPSWGMPIEEAVVTPEHKTKKGKHRFVGTQHVKSTVYSGAGWGGICIACGRPDTDPDHDGDVDTPGGSGDRDQAVRPDPGAGQGLRHRAQRQDPGHRTGQHLHPAVGEGAQPQRADAVAAGPLRRRREGQPQRRVLVHRRPGAGRGDGPLRSAELAARGQARDRHDRRHPPRRPRAGLRPAARRALHPGCQRHLAVGLPRRGLGRGDGQRLRQAVVLDGVHLQERRVRR
jgi:hypothetical protein